MNKVSCISTDMLLACAGLLRVCPVDDYHVIRPVDTVENYKDTGEQVESNRVHGLLQLLGLLILDVLPYLSVQPGRVRSLRNERILLSEPPTVPHQRGLSVTSDQALPAQVSLLLVEVALLQPGM